ncbi:MAG: ribonuclease HII [Rhodoluna sp.]|nr:ribonuclease HII [Rhodoluna sp.]
MSSKTFPTIELESQIFGSGIKQLLAIDEVGRGAIAGPVAVGVTLTSPDTYKSPWPTKMRDSKLMTEKQREESFQPVADWVDQWAVGMSSAEEIDKIGITKALALAAERAIEQLTFDPATTRILLDGSHNWLGNRSYGVAVAVRPKADRDCVSVAAASVLAKVTRDHLMVELAKDFPGYGFEGHKGYASEAHIEAVRRLRPSIQHRVTWLDRILGIESK